MRRSLQLSPSLIFLSAWDIFKTRLFLLTVLSYLVMLPPLLLNLVARDKSVQRSLIILAALFLLLLGACALIGRWSAQTEKDVRGGNATSFRSLWNQSFGKTFHRPLARPPFTWRISAFLICLGIPMLNLCPLQDLTPLLYLLLPPLLPLLCLIFITRVRLKTEFSSPSPTVKRSEPDLVLNTDRTRPMSSFAPAAADETVSAQAGTNPAGFSWSPENRQALLLDLLTGHINYEEASRRFGLKIQELQSWMEEYMRQDQSPEQNRADIPENPQKPA